VIRPGPPFGAYPTLEVDDGRVQLVVCPALGARVLRLVDLWTGRDWLVPGTPPPADAAGVPIGWGSADATYDGDAAFGWDECLPTVGRCTDPGDAAAPPLRDHGELWGRPAAVEGVGTELTATWRDARLPFTFRRRLRLDGPRVVAEYELANAGPLALPVLWSMHPLLALEAGARIEVEGLVTVLVTHVAGLPLAPVPGRADWPETPGTDGRPIVLDVVGDPGAGTAAKLYGGWGLYGAWDASMGEGLPGVAAVVQPDGARLELSWYAPIAPNLGIWLSDGGWPSPPAEPRVQHALQPTTSADDDLAAAVAAGRALVVEPEERVAWSATFRVRAPGEARGV
jgi:hypothetical protein